MYPFFIDYDGYVLVEEIFGPADPLFVTLQLSILVSGDLGFHIWRALFEGAAMQKTCCRMLCGQF